MTTIAEAFVLAAKAKGASADASAQSIAEAIDLLNDTLAGENETACKTIADAIVALTPNIGTVTPTGSISITENGEGIDVARYATADVSVSGGGGTAHSIACKIWDDGTSSFTDMPSAVSEATLTEDGWTVADPPTYVTQATAGTVLYGSDYTPQGSASHAAQAYGTASDSAWVVDVINEELRYLFVMPDADCVVVYSEK